MVLRGNILFTRLWQVIYLAALLLSLFDRLGVFGWRQQVPLEVVPLNILAVVAAAVAWALFEKRNPFGLLAVRVLSVLRMLATSLNASIVFGFIIAFIPTGSFPWQWLIRLPTPLYLSTCALILGIEVVFFVETGGVWKRPTSNQVSSA
jgi:hypothetical protein